jgi:two-component system sensor histidine kinase ChvG
MKSIRTKLVIASFLIILPPIYFLNHYAIRSFDDFTSRTLEEEMINQATVLGEYFRAVVLNADAMSSERGRVAFQQLLESFGAKVQSRLQILSPAGVVLFDSGQPSTVGTDLSARRGVASAMRGTYQAEWEVSPDREYVFFFVPLPILEDGRIVGIAYVTHHTGQITKAILRMKDDQRMALLIAVAFAVVVSLLLAQTMTRRLRALTRAAMGYATGSEANLNLPHGGNDEISELAGAVGDMATEIERRNEYNREFMSTVMHELKTPVTAIKGAVEVLQEGAFEDQEARQRFLENIRYEADRLMRLAGELGQLTRVDVETLRGQRETLDYCACVRSVLDRLMPTFDQEHAAFEAVIPTVPILVRVSPGRIEQVISNILENAFRYTPRDGRVELRIETSDMVKTSISDTGTGISDAHLPRVFDRFFTTEPRGEPRDYGSGLGLSIAKSIVENHQGQIWAESPPGEGARIIFCLPTVPDG